MRRRPSARSTASVCCRCCTGETLPPRPLCWHFPNYTNQGGRPAGAIRDGDWKLDRTTSKTAAWSFSISRMIIGETKNLAETEAAARSRTAAANCRRGGRASARRCRRRIRSSTRRCIGGCMSIRIPSRLMPAKTAAETATEVEGLAGGDEPGDQRTASRRSRPRRATSACTPKTPGFTRRRCVRTGAAQERARLLDQSRRLGRLGIRSARGRAI